MKDDKHIPKLIVSETLDYRSKFVTIVPGLTFNQYETINTIYFYWNSKFQSGSVDDEGDRKYFYNIVKNPCKVCSKAIDFDTKNIRMLTAGGGDPLKTWFMERDLKYWMRDVDFGMTLNRIFAELPVYGTVVLKEVDGKLYFVDLRNFVVEQSADTLDDTSYIDEIHNMTVSQFRKTAKKMGWQQSIVDDVITKFRQMKGSHIRLIERYGEVQTDFNIWKYQRSFVADVEWNVYDPNGNLVNVERGILIDSEDWDDGHPYWEFHLEKIPGRWLGVGVVESLFEPQIRQNELCNLQAKSSYWAALRIWQTVDGAINRNLFSDVRNGEVLNVDSEIIPVDMADRNLAFFNEEYTKWLKNRDELTFSYDVVQGERLPAGTPLGSAQIAMTQTLSYFELIQENVALGIKKMLFDVILPEFEKQSTPEHTLRLVGQDLDEYVEMVRNDLVNKEIIRQAVDSVSKGGAFPTNADREVISIGVEQAIKQGKEKILTVPAGFYKDAKYDIDIDITGESVDTRVRYATMFAILQAITADPTMTQDPVKKKILFRMAEDGGINPSDFFASGSTPASPEAQAINSKGAGGGVSAPALGTKIAGPAAQTV